MIIDWFMNYSQIHDYLVYGVIVVLSFVEGPIIAIVCGLLLRFGVIAIIPTYIALMLGDLVGDALWYWIGHRFGHAFIARFGHYFHVTEADVEKVKGIFHRYTSAIIFVSKISMGLGFALVTLITAGISRIPFGRYIALNAMGQFIWTAILLVLGFFLGHLYVTFDNIFARVSIVAGAVVLGVAVLQYGRFVKSHFSARL